MRSQRSCVLVGRIRRTSPERLSRTPAPRGGEPTRAEAAPRRRGARRGRAARCPPPPADVQVRRWEVIREAGSLSNDVLSAVISGFIASSALPLIEDYVDEYFAGLLGFWT